MSKRIDKTLELEFMRQALELAEKYRGRTSPNPHVGAVIVKGGKIVGSGNHKRAGGQHAEVAALRSAGSRAKGATMYVTLEPCAHVGRTGPCTEAIVKSGISEVVYSITDPNPLVNGRGARELRRNGIAVRKGLLKEPVERSLELYLHRRKTKRPFVILKTAQTLDGRIATRDGHSQWISSEQTLKLAHQLRAEVDAVVIGAGAANIDNPQLTVRRVSGPNPYRIVLSTNGDVSPKLRLFTDNKDRRTILVTATEALPQSLSKLPRLIHWCVSKAGDKLSLQDFLAKAPEFGIHSLLVEGGGALGTAFLKSGLVDKHVVVIAPMTLGGGRDAVGDLGSKKISDAISYRSVNFSQMGRDMVFTGYPVCK